MEKLLKIIAKFAVTGQPASIAPYGNGHINTTYKATCKKDGKEYCYILQRINNKVFPDVQGLMRNIAGICAHVKEKIAKGGYPGERALTIVPTNRGEDFLYDESGYFRVYDFISEGISIESAQSLTDLEVGGKGIGRFQRLLADYDAASLSETIPYFHFTPKRYADLQRAAEEDAAGRAQYCAEELDFYLSRSHFARLFTDALAAGRIPLRVCHNDGKLNNVLIDTAGNRYVAVIDLDTVMPGAGAYDLGDSVRFGASTGAEDEADLSKVRFSLSAFRAILRGYLSEAAYMLTPEERELLPYAGLIMTYECGMRFLADYLNGDTYFAVRKEGHNLLRARTQMKLVADMEELMPEIKNAVNEEIKNYNKLHSEKH